MLKFFRKYIVNKYVLTTVGVVLMVVFLLPGVSMFLPDPADNPYGYIGEQTVTNRDVQTAAAELEMLAELGRFFPDLAAGLPDSGLHWRLALHEAHQQGIHTAQSQARGLVQQWTQQLTEAGIDPSVILRRAGGNEPLLIQAVGHWQTYNTYRAMVMGWNIAGFQGGARASEQRLRHLARDTLSRATVDLIAVDASHLISDEQQPTEQQLREHFEQYRGDRPGESEPYGFGYFLPPRIRIEYLMVPLDRVAETIQINEVEAQRYYMEHPERFMPPAGPEGGEDADAEGATPDAPDASAADDPADSGAPGAADEASADPPSDEESAEPQAAPDPDEPLPYRRVRDRVIRELRDSRAREKQQQIVRWLTAELSERTRRLPADDLGYLRLPDDYRPPGFEDLAARAQERFGVLPDVVRIENRWLTLDEAADLGGLGTARLELGNRTIPMRQYLASTRELETETSEQLMSLRLQVNVASQPLTDDAGNRYIFRVIAAEAAHEPRSLDEVRTEVARDVKRLAAYRRLTERADTLLERARQEDWPSLAESFNTAVETLGPFSGLDMQALLIEGRASVPSLPVVGRSERFVREVFELAERIREGGGLAAVEEAQKITVIPVDRAQKVCLVKLVGYQPVDTQRYNSFKPQLNRFAGLADMQPLLAQADNEGPLSLEALKQRTGYTDAQPAESAGDGERTPEVPVNPLLR